MYTNDEYSQMWLASVVPGIIAFTANLFILASLALGDNKLRAGVNNMIKLASVRGRYGWFEGLHTGRYHTKLIVPVVGFLLQVLSVIYYVKNMYASGRLHICQLQRISVHLLQAILYFLVYGRLPGLVREPQGGSA
jgi:hypothetical protein